MSFPLYRRRKSIPFRSGRFASAARRILLLAGMGVLLLPLPGCQSITGTTSISQVRIIDASPDAPALDFYQSGSVLAYNLGLGTITSYVPITPGNYTIIADTAGTRQQVISANGTFQGGAQYTVMVGNFSNSLQEIILKDQAQSAPAGQISVRFVDQSTRAGLMDLYLVPSGSMLTAVRPVLSGIGFSTNTGYFNVPAGTYTLVALPAFTIPTASTVSLYSGPAINYAGGSAKTIVLLDQQLVTTPGIQTIVANDFDPAGTN